MDYNRQKCNHINFIRRIFRSKSGVNNIVSRFNVYTANGERGRESKRKTLEMSVALNYGPHWTITIQFIIKVFIIQSRCSVMCDVWGKCMRTERVMTNCDSIVWCACVCESRSRIASTLYTYLIACNFLKINIESHKSNITRMFGPHFHTLKVYHKRQLQIICLRAHSHSFTH